MIGGIGVGTGGKLAGLSIAGVGVGAPRVSGIVLTGAGAGTVDFNGGVIAPLYFRIAEGGSIARSNPRGRRVLPIANWGSRG